MGKMKCIGGRIINCYSKNDYVLKYIFKILKSKVTPVGLVPLDDNGKVFNIDLAKQIRGHLKYQNLFEDILD